MIRFLIILIISFAIDSPVVAQEESSINTDAGIALKTTRSNNNTFSFVQNDFGGYATIIIHELESCSTVINSEVELNPFIVPLACLTEIAIDGTHLKSKCIVQSRDICKTIFTMSSNLLIVGDKKGACKIFKHGNCTAPIRMKNKITKPAQTGRDMGV